MSEEITQRIDSQAKEAMNQLVTSSPAPWGKLLPLSKKLRLPAVDLVEFCYRVGRARCCDIVLTEEMMGEGEEHRLPAVSSTHCLIGFDEERGYPIIEDCSRNGTYIDGQKMDKSQKKSPLFHNARIALSNPLFEVYLFYDTRKDEEQQNGYPQEIKDKYKVYDLLGNGASGAVMRAVEKKTMHFYAIKIMEKKADVIRGMNSIKSIINEVTIMKALKHPCVVRVKEVVDLPNTTYLVMELMKGKSLWNYSKCFPFNDTLSKFILYQVLLAVEYLHSKKVVHRDLKPHNILVSCAELQNALVKVSDFGISKCVEESELYTYCGTRGFLAPEVLPYRRDTPYTTKCDIWSTGVVLYLCLTGQMPFECTPESPEQMLFNMKQGAPHVPSHPEELRDLIQNMLTVDPSERPSATDVLSNSWFKDPTMQQKVKLLMEGKPLPQEMESDPPRVALSSQRQEQDLPTVETSAEEGTSSLKRPRMDDSSTLPNSLIC